MKKLFNEQKFSRAWSLLGVLKGVSIPFWLRKSRKFNTTVCYGTSTRLQKFSRWFVYKHNIRSTASFHERATKCKLVICCNLQLPQKRRKVRRSSLQKQWLCKWKQWQMFQQKAWRQLVSYASYTCCSYLRMQEIFENLYLQEKRLLLRELSPFSFDLPPVSSITWAVRKR